MEVKKLKKIVIREELFTLTKDTFEAIILSQLIYWQERVNDFDKFIIEEKNRNIQEGKEKIDIQLTKGWMYKSATELKDECMLSISEVTIRRYLQKLIDKHYVECRKNPLNKWDRTLQYRVNMKFVISKVKSLGFDGLSGYKLQEEAMKLQNEDSYQKNEEAIPYTTNIDYYREEEEKDKSFSKKDDFLPFAAEQQAEYGKQKKKRNSTPKDDELFEECWKEYRRKGHKNKAKPYWNKLPQEERNRILPHIKAYVSARELSYQEDFERYLKNKTYDTIVCQRGNVIYDPERLSDKETYRPECDGFNLHWNSISQCYITFGDPKDLNDGYTKDNRPNGAKVKQNGNLYVWSSEKKEWIKQN